MTTGNGVGSAYPQKKVGAHGPRIMGHTLGKPQLTLVKVLAPSIQARIGHLGAAELRIEPTNISLSEML